MPDSTDIQEAQLTHEARRLLSHFSNDYGAAVLCLALGRLFIGLLAFVPIWLTHAIDHPSAAQVVIFAFALMFVGGLVREVWIKLYRAHKTISELRVESANQTKAQEESRHLTSRGSI